MCLEGAPTGSITLCNNVVIDVYNSRRTESELGECVYRSQKRLWLRPTCPGAVSRLAAPPPSASRPPPPSRPPLMERMRKIKRQLSLTLGRGGAGGGDRMLSDTITQEVTSHSDSGNTPASGRDDCGRPGVAELAERVGECCCGNLGWGMRLIFDLMSRFRILLISNAFSLFFFFDQPMNTGVLHSHYTSLCSHPSVPPPFPLASGFSHLLFSTPFVPP